MTTRHDMRSDERSEFRSFPPETKAPSGWAPFWLVAGPILAVFVTLGILALNAH